ncbi:MAG TPA: NAD-dependent epimerase/dehydratase family protein [Trinickia sp.]|jgi:2'-hydroxyisoflavone reductase|uniref:NAD-dependent epimerase/dehydratase family protein n=1 Tax=Trinickia sp. TaxID=2571163 RepID=UPI002C3E89A4|nr:NAD-dependent epimerase/dehydratase family protein [Trinickia sp.]HTI16075.1 NAD-dependent epimerase/dehydratase family protein [Trinickia sp.]
MRILVMGGTLFLGRHIVEAALKSGHDVTIFNRGRQAPSLFAEIERLSGDRDSDLSALAGRQFDAVIDPSAYTPEHIHLVLSALKAPPEHYTFISSISVYRSFPPGTRYDEDADVLQGNDGYGALKARTEAAIQSAMPGRVAILRPGLIVGPYDPTGRFTYWIRRIAAGGHVLAPGRRERPIQFIDARDVAKWCLQMAEGKASTVLNAVGPASTLTMEQFLIRCEEVSQSGARLAWLADEQVLEAGIEGWTELPLWIAESDTEAGGIFHADNSRALSCGLPFMPLTQTIQDTLQWVRETGGEKANPLQVETLRRPKEQATLARFGL